MALSKHQVNLLVGYMVALFHRNGWTIPPGLTKDSGIVGTVKRQMIRHVQTTYKLKVSGEFDTATQKFLTPADPRAKRVGATLFYQHWAVSQHNRFIYSQTRPVVDRQELFLLPAGGRLRDCWGEATDGWRYGGFGHPDSFTFASGIGNTDSTLAWARERFRLRVLADVRQCDAVIFSNPGHIVCITDPRPEKVAGVRLEVSSDGHQGAPEYVTLEQEIASHPGPYYVIAID